MNSEFKEFNVFVENVLSKERCEELINICKEKGFEDAPLHDAVGNEFKAEDHRKNKRVIIESDELAAELHETIKYYIPESVDFCSPVGLNPYLRFYEYNEGDFFNKHKDRPLRLDNGEYSIFTVLFYLNEDYKGGRTLFENFNVTPKTGSAVIFNHRMFHAGEKIKEGKKYAIRSDVIYRAAY